MKLRAVTVWVCLAFCAQVSQVWCDWSPCFSWPWRLPWGWALWGGWGSTLEHPTLSDLAGCGERGCGALPIFSTKEISIRKSYTKISGGCEAKCSGIRKCQSDISCAVFSLCPPLCSRYDATFERSNCFHSFVLKGISFLVIMNNNDFLIL